MFYMYMSIRYRYNASGMCENPGSVLLTTSYTKNVNFKIDFKVQNLICLSKLKITNIRVENPTLEKAK